MPSPTIPTPASPCSRPKTVSGDEPWARMASAAIAKLDKMADKERSLENAVKMSHRAEKARYQAQKDKGEKGPKAKYTMEMPPVRVYESLTEVTETPEMLKLRYGRHDMSSCTIVAYIEGKLEFITPSAATDYRIDSESKWQTVRDRVIGLLDSGQNAALVLCNELRESKGQPPLPNPKPSTSDEKGAQRRVSFTPGEEVVAKGLEDFKNTALDAIERAEELIRERESRDEERQKEWDKLPLFEAGKTYSREDAKDGFRVKDGYAVSYNMDDDVCIDSERHESHDPEKIMTVITRWPDGGIAWMYWTNTPPRGANGTSLRECVMRYGMGGWTNEEKDFRAKVVFLDSERSVQPGRCFILAMDRPSTGAPMLVKGNELNNDVFRIYRSSIPDYIQKLITLRELVNARQFAESEKDPSKLIAGWWHM